MSVSAKIEEGVRTHNIALVRMNLILSLNRDFGKFQENWDYCLKNGITEEEIFQEHDGGEIKTDETAENLATLTSELSLNFSRERLTAAKRISRKLFPAQPKESTPPSAAQQRKGGSTASHGSAGENCNGTIYAVGAVIGAVAGGVIGGKISGGVLGGVLGAVAGAFIGAVAAGIIASSGTGKDSDHREGGK